MPRSKPKAHRLAPPLQHSATQLESYPVQSFHTVPSLSAANDAKQDRFEQSRHQPNNPLSTASHLDDPTSSVVLNEKSTSDPTSRTKKRKKSHDVSQRPPSRPGQSPAVDPSDSPDLEGTRSSPQSCSSSDTASVGLAEDIPPPQPLGNGPHLIVENNYFSDSYKHNNNQRKKHTSNDRVPNTSSRLMGPFQSVLLDSSRSRKNVEADPTSFTIPGPLCEAPPSQAQFLGKGERHSFSFLADDEAKAIFDTHPSNLNGGKGRLSERKVDKDKLREYWQELETVSIRKSSQTEKANEKKRHNRLKQMTNNAPCLHANNGEVSSEVAKTSDAAPLPLLKHREIREMLHPITEENLDGGDAIPMGKHRKRKFVKKAKCASDLMGGSTERDTQVHELEKRVSKETKRKKSWTSKSGEAVRRGVVAAEENNTASSTGFSESDGQACIECGSHGNASKMVLCDACSDGCHTFCMRPARRSVPLGVWMCPRCHMLAKKHEIHLSKLSLFIETHGFES